MIETRNYLVGKNYPVLKLPIGQVSNVTDKNFIRRDGVLVNGFNSMLLYISDGGGGYTLLPPGAYDPQATLDKGWTAQEALANDGTGSSIYSQWRLIDNSYINTDLFVDITDWGTLGDNDAPFTRVGGEITVTATGAVEIPEGYTQIIIKLDTTAGDLTATIGGGTTTGQRISLSASGPNEAVSSGNGIVSSLSNGDNEAYLWDKDNSTWIKESLKLVRAECNGISVVNNTSPIQFTNVKEDTHGAITTGSSWRFTAPRDMVANIKGFSRYEGGDVIQTIGLYLNNVLNKTIGRTQSSTGGPYMFSGSVRMKKGEYIHVEETRNISFTNTSQTTYWIVIESTGNQ